MVEEMKDMPDFEIHRDQVVTGMVVKIEDKQALIDIGYKTEAILPISEVSSLHLDDIRGVLNVGDELQVKVKKITDEEVVVSKREIDALKAWEQVEEKYKSGEIFEVVVKDIVKGGLVVDIGVRGFIPASLVERHYVEDFSDYIGRSIDVKVVELDQEKNRVILSHKAVVEGELNAKKKETLENLEVGQVLEGTVQRLTDFGAFVDIGGVDGLVHISEMAHHRVERPSDIVTEGQKVEVKVLGVDRDTEKVKLSIKETQPGPWQQMEGKIEAGDIVKGRVRRLVQFGAFIELAPQVEGLLHISQIANRHIGSPSEVLEEGQEIEAKVLEVRLDEHKISLSTRVLEEEEGSSEDYSDYSNQSEGFSVADLTEDDSETKE
ncbi:MULTISPECIES: 30S ribosomal protein S1 [Exiguobacterium]|jgi:small subunit ribosomal protein S1|uniref:30S ribosomal protein S1 n=1 Tax=Exiguobacterium TaxID=33986 RepID=UPI0006F39994|nr:MULTISPECIES: 30S ribosomal protein S1 [unclassified Exiguobacterium]KQS40050.1 30S ribosomal protein S1 [Exiguobacterium sp. Leaf196]MDT0172091.1 30S ribosomal protein S1 [Exiguobacterium sp. BRG2]HAL01255.1 30S ribosomal protein S1 [Exiguobacterium sp.]HAZ38954.1 30S ribosomal protein S1 [Exiguobacterium sp.]HCV52412.1 30S ribosomal protein S1 [Exiguobacterium sp.]